MVDSEEVLGPAKRWKLLIRPKDTKIKFCLRKQLNFGAILPQSYWNQRYQPRTIMLNLILGMAIWKVWKDAAFATAMKYWLVQNPRPILLHRYQRELYHELVFTWRILSATHRTSASATKLTSVGVTMSNAHCNTEDNLDKSFIFSLMGGDMSTEVTFALLTQLSWVRISRLVVKIPNP